MKYLAVLFISTLLVACGGGGGGGDSGSSGSAAAPTSAVSSSLPTPSTVSPATAALAKYEGVWRQACVDHMRLTMTSTATGSTTFTVMKKEEYFDNADCTGALVATGSFGVPDETVQYTSTLANASVKLPTGETIVADVDPATSVLAVAPFDFTGTGVTSTYALDTTIARINYSNGEYAIIQRQASSGKTTHGALLLRNGELLALVPIAGSPTTFQVNRQYGR